MTGERPEFLWDPRRLRLVWANADGLRFWDEESLSDLAERVFAPEDDSARALAARHEAVCGGGEDEAAFFLRPEFEPVRVRARCAAEHAADGRPLLRVRLTGTGGPVDRLSALSQVGFESAPQALAIFSEDGAVLTRNEADRRVFGPEARALAERYANPDEGRRALQAALGGGAHSRKADLLAADGPARYRVSLRRMSDPTSGAPAAIAEFRDVSFQPPAPEPSPEALARLAHDLRSPLMAVEGFAEFIALSGEMMEPERRNAYLADIRLASRRMLALVDDIVALGARAGRGPSTIDLRAIAEEAARFHAPALALAEMTLQINGAERAPVLADEITAHRIVGNLMANALEHGARAGGALRLILRSDAAETSLEIADDGPGMSAAALEAALAPGPKGERRGGGRIGGLGLSNVVELAKEMGARLDIRTAPGNGFAARLVFPAGATPCS